MLPIHLTGIEILEILNVILMVHVFTNEPCCRVRWPRKRLKGVSDPTFIAL